MNNFNFSKNQFNNNSNTRIATDLNGFGNGRCSRDLDVIKKDMMGAKFAYKHEYEPLQKQPGLPNTQSIPEKQSEINKRGLEWN